MMFIQGQLYRRRELHARLGGQQQGGISTPTAQNLILLFTGDSGEQYGYRDGWSAEGVFLYTGEGQRGDMEFVRGNRAIRDHADDGKDLHLFEQAEKALLRYVGQMVCTGYQEREAPDTDGKPRRAIVFELTPLAEFTEGEAGSPREPHTPPAQLAGLSLAELRRRALAVSASSRTPTERRAQTRLRSEAIKLYVQSRANGTCEGCGAPAPFKRPDGSDYLEPHHIRRLSDGGPDHPRWVVAVCANCHRRAHYADDAASYNKHLGEVAARLEADVS